MHIALEYIFRTNCLKPLIKFPISIFVEHKKLDHKIVIVISEYNDELKVKHWYISRCIGQFLPSFFETIIDKHELFTHKCIILPDHYILRFTQNSFGNGRQSSDYPMGLMQQQEYKNYIDSFYNPEVHQVKRMNWLWESFKASNKDNINENPYCFPYFGYNNLNELFTNQRIKVEKTHKKVWNSWLLWRKYLLDFPTNVAPELLFQKEYLNSE